MRARLWLTTVMLVACGLAGAASAGADAFPTDHTPRFPVEPAGEPWSDPFSLIAGGGTLRPADGVVAGSADLGTVWTGTRDGAGRVLVSSTSGLWAVGLDGRLERIDGVPSGRGHRDQLATLADGSVAVSTTRSPTVYEVAAGSRRATPLATTGLSLPLGIGSGPEGRLLAVAGGRLLRLHGTQLVATGPRLWDDDGIREPRGIGSLADGSLLVGTLFPNNGVAGDPEGDDSAVLLGRATVRPVTLLAPPPPQAVRKVAVLRSGLTLVATNASTEGDLDARPLALAAGPRLDPQRFSYGVGEEFFGWIARRRVLVRERDGALRRTRWAGPPADDIAQDGADVLVASRGRLWSTKRGLGAPGLAGLWHGHVAVRLGAAVAVTVTARNRAGHLVAVQRASLPAGRSVVRLRGLPASGLVRVTVRASAPTVQRSASAWAFSGPRRLSPAEADRVLSGVARRLYVGFEGAAAHGVDRCTTLTATQVRCRWSTAGQRVPSTERAVTVQLRPAGYLLRPGAPSPSPPTGRNRHLLGAPFDASA
ncbi:MAG TPA: hypothetical protein VNT03_12840 [Baekduia sp.]|nr:hypothetical protein [Baekduia sp.]